MGRILAIDYGERRVGIAVSDESGSFAHPRSAIENAGKKRFFEAIADLVRSEGIERIVVGLPLTLRGEVGKQAAGVQSVMHELEEVLSVPVEFEDERLTSSYADRFRGSSTDRDSIAAASILETYLERTRRRSA